MQWGDILSRLNDLPATYLRRGPNFNTFQNSLALGLHRFTNSTEGAITQAQATQAVSKWLDVVGKMRNIVRFDGEPDNVYLTRIEYLLNTPGGPPNAILGLLNTLNHLNATMVENFTTVSWSVALGSYISATQASQLATGLNYVRPAGVPFQLTSLRGGLFLNTLNYLTRWRATGSYLVNPLSALATDLKANTNNAIALLPTIYLTDPTLNPGLPTS